MGFNGTHNNADGRDPDFGAIFMSNSGTKRECLKRRLFGLPSSEIQFVEQVKAGMILFLFEYEKRQLHGVFKASCDGAINIVSNAFSSSGKQFPAQVKFIAIWDCKPLPESLFRNAIKENYFSANKFNFGLSEKQVYKLLYLFNMRKLELEVPTRLLTRTKDLKSEWYPVSEVGGSFDRGMHVESGQNEQGVGANISPIIMHKYQGDSLQYNGEVENIGFNAGDIGLNKQGRATELAVDTTHGYVSDYLPLKDECGLTPPEKEHHMGIHLRPTISGGYSKSPSDKIRVHSDGRLSMSDKLMSEDLRKTGQRMVFSDDIPGLHDSNVNPSFFYSKPILERNSLVQNQLRPTSAMIDPIQAQILNNSCVTQGDVSSKSTLLYDPGAPGLNFSQPSYVRINNGSKSILENASPSNNCGRNSLSNQPCLMHTELKDINRCHDVGYGFLNPGPYGSNRGCMPLPFNVARNSDQLAVESVAYEARNSIPSLKSSSAPVPPSDIGNSGGVHETFSSLFHNYKSWVGNDVHSIALRENLGHEMTLQKKNETFTPVVPWANEGHSQVQYGDRLIHECDVNYQNNNSGYPKKKSSVFSRLSFVQNVDKQENGNNAWNEEYDFNTSVDKVMEMARQSHKQWMTKGKPKPLVKRNNAECLKDKTPIISSRMKSDCFENALENVSVENALETASEGNTNETAEEIYFVDFKRRSKVRKLNDEIEIRSSKESENSENLVLVPQKRKKLIRPNFSKSTTSDDKGIDLGASQNLQVPLSHESYNLKDVSESYCSLVQTENNIKTDAEAQNLIGQTHSEDKSSSHARGYVCSEGGGKARDVSECLENINNQNAFSSASCEDKSCHIKDMESLPSICQEHYVDKVICAGRGVNTEEGMSKDGGSSFTIEVKDGSDCLQKSGNEKAPIETSRHIKEGLGVDSIKSVPTDTESLPSICQEHQVDKIICAGRGINIEKEMSKDGGSSFTAEVKDGSDCLQNSGNENAPIATCHVEEGLCMMDGKKSESLDIESLQLLCQEHHVDKVICAGRDINPEGMLKDGSSSFTAEVKDGSDCSKNSGNDNAPVATSCEQKMA